jgi:ABC-type molybdate transport system substrate-binding protein
LELEPILIAASPPAPEVVYEVAIVNREPREEERGAQAQRFFDFLGSETVIRKLEAAGFSAP